MDKKIKVLIVEDNFDNVLTALIAMEELDVEPIIASNVEKALEILQFRSKEFLCVLSDMHMPLSSEGGYSKEAGKIVIKECINRHIPSLVITKGVHHHEKTCIEILMPDPMFALAKETVEEFSLVKVKEIECPEKKVKVWKEAFQTLKEILGDDLTENLKTRRLYQKYVERS